MKNPIFTSATKSVLVGLVATLCLLMIVACIILLLSPGIDAGAKLEIVKTISGIFSSAMLLVLGFYFSKGQPTTGPVIEPEPEKKIEPTVQQ